MLLRQKLDIKKIFGMDSEKSAAYTCPAHPSFHEKSFFLFVFFSIENCYILILNFF